MSSRCMGMSVKSRKCAFHNAMSKVLFTLDTSRANVREVAWNHLVIQSGTSATPTRGPLLTISKVQVLARLTAYITSFFHDQSHRQKHEREETLTDEQMGQHLFVGYLRSER